MTRLTIRDIQTSAHFAPVPAWSVAAAPRPRLLIATIQAEVARFYRIPVAEMLSDRQAWSVARPRQVGMYLAHHLTPRSYSEIGRRFRRDHSTVMHAVRAVAQRRIADADLDQDIAMLAARLAPPVIELSTQGAE